MTSLRDLVNKIQKSSLEKALQEALIQSLTKLKGEDLKAIQTILDEDIKEQKLIFLTANNESKQAFAEFEARLDKDAREFLEQRSI